MDRKVQVAQSERTFVCTCRIRQARVRPPLALLATGFGQRYFGSELKLTAAAPNLAGDRRQPRDIMQERSESNFDKEHPASDPEDSCRRTAAIGKMKKKYLLGSRKQR